MDLLSLTEDPPTGPNAASAQGAAHPLTSPNPRMEAARLIAYRIANAQRITRAKLREAMTAATAPGETYQARFRIVLPSGEVQ